MEEEELVLDEVVGVGVTEVEEGVDEAVVLLQPPEQEVTVMVEVTRVVSSWSE